MSVRDVIQAAAGVGTEEKDQYFANTTLLLQGDVSNPDLSYNAFSDASGNEVNITPYGEARGSSFSPYNAQDGHWGVSFNRGGTVEYIKLPNTASLEMGSGDFTYEAWIKLDRVNTGQTIFSPIDAAADSWRGAIFGVNSDNKLYVNIYNSGGANQTTLIHQTVLNSNVWYHVSCTRKTGVFRLFVNGVVSTNTYTFTGTLTQSGSTIASAYDGTGPFCGIISNLRLVKGRAVYDANFTPPTSPLTTTSGGVNPPQGSECVFLGFNSRYFFDRANNRTHTIINNPQVVPVDAFQSLDATSGSGVFETSASNYLSADGQISFGSGDFCLEFWTYLFQSSDDPIFESRVANNTAGGFTVTSLSNNSFRLWDTTARVSYTHTSASSILYQWFHICVERVSGTTSFYINGNFIGDTEAFGNLSSTVFRLGGGYHYGAFGGYISDVRLVKGAYVRNGAFTPPISALEVHTTGTTEILTLQTRGAVRNIGIVDESAYNHGITKNGNCAQGTFSPFSQEEGKWSNYFDGSSKFNIPDTTDFTFTGAFTVEAWVYWVATSTAASGYECVLGGHNSTATTWGMYLKYSNSYASFFVNNTLVETTTAVPRNQWVHIAATRDGSNVVRVFINGVQRTSTPTIPGTIETPAGGLNIGRDLDTNGYFNGYASNIRVVKDQAIYTSDFTPSRSPLTTSSQSATSSNVKLLTCQSNRFLDNSTSSVKTLTVTAGSPSVQPFSPFAPSAAYDPDVNGGSVYFDGNDSLLIPSGYKTFDMTGESYCFEAWIYPTTADEISIFNRMDGTGGPGFSIQRLSSSNTYARKILFFTSSSGVMYGTKVVPENQWTHVVCNYTAGGYKRIYINGELDNETNSGTFWQNPSTTVTLGIGVRPSDNRNFYFKGWMSGIRVTRANPVYTAPFNPLTAPPSLVSNTSLLLNFTNAGVIDATGRNVIETVGSARTDASVVKFGNGSFQTNQNGNGCLQIPQSEHFALYGDWTIEFWYKGTATGGDPSLFRRMFDQGGGNSAAAFQIIINTADSQYSGNSGAPIAWDGGSTGTGYIPDNGTGTTPGVSDGNWHYVAVVREGTSMRTYVDGTLGTTRTISASANWDKTSQAYPLTIGASSVTTSEARAVANFDDFRLTNGVARYTGSTHTVPTKSLPNQ